MLLVFLTSSLLLVTLAVGQSMGGVLTMASGFMPAELRGVTGIAGTALLAGANKERGMLLFVTDGSDYPWTCLCPTASQLTVYKKSYPNLAADKCPEDQKMGCRPPQVDMTGAPEPQFNVPKAPGSIR